MRASRRLLGVGLVGGFVAGGLAFGVSPVATAAITSVDPTFDLDGTATVPLLASGSGYGNGILASGAGYGNGLEIAATNQGAVYVAGFVTRVDYIYSGVAVTRLLDDGTVDNAFNEDGIVTYDDGESSFTEVVDLAATDDEGVLLLVREDFGVDRDDFGVGPVEFRLVKLLSNGLVDDDFGTDGVFVVPGTYVDRIDSLTLDERDGSIVLVGSVPVIDLGDVYGVFKVTAAGQPAWSGDGGWFEANGWLELPTSWEGFPTVDVDSAHRIMIADGYGGELHRISALGVLETTFPAIPVSGQGFHVVGDGFQTFAYELGEDGCASLRVQSFDETGDAGTQTRISLGCGSRKEYPIEIVTTGADAFLLTDLDFDYPNNRLIVRRIGRSGELSIGFGVNGVATQPPGVEVASLAHALAVDGAGRPLIAFKEYTDEGSVLRVTRFLRNGARPIEKPIKELPGGAGRQGGTAVADPVDPATGNLTDTWADLPGEVFGLTVTRSYNGLSSLSSSLGARWSVSTGPSVFDDDGDGSVAMVTPSGVRYRFLADGSGGYLPAEGVAGVLTIDSTVAPSGGGILPMLKLAYNDGSVDRFDTAGRLTSQSAWDGQSATSVYGPNGVTSVTSSTGQSVSFGYDASGRLSGVSMSSGRSVGYAYDAAGLLSSITDEHGAVWTITYTVEGWLKTMTDPTGVVLEDNTYDTQGRVILQLLPSNTRVTFVYDDSSAETTVTESYSSNGEWYQQSRLMFAHDTEGKVIVIYDETSNLSVVKTYDEAGNLVANKTRGDLEESATYDADYNLTSVTDPATGTTTYTYDTSDRMLTVTTPSGATTTYTYQGAERSPSTVTDALGNTTTYDIVNGLVMSQTDADGVTTTNTYDTQRRLLSTSDEYGNTTTRAYDSQSRMVRAETEQGRVNTWSYGPSGRLTSTTAPDGGVTSYTYDPAGRVLTVTDPTGAVTTNGYDGAGNLVTVTDPGGNVTTYGYDHAGRRVSTLRPGTTTAMNIGRDHVGRVVNESTVLGNNTESAYSADGQVESTVSSPIGGQTLNGFDNTGRRVSTTDEAGRVSTSTFDEFGRVATTVATGGATTTFGYDALGRQATVTDARGGLTTTTFTAGGRTASMTDPAELMTSYGYDLAGRQTTVTAPGNRVTTTVYDGDGQVTSTTSPGGLVTAYTYDNGGRVATITDPAGAVTTRTYTLRGELATEKAGAQGTIRYVYNPTGTLASVTDANGRTTTFTYDGRGNMLTRTNALGGIDRWTYNAADQVLTSTDPLGRITTMVYDQAGQLTSMTDPSGRSVTLTYNPDGTPNTQTTGVGDTTYTYDAAGRVASMTDTAGTMSYRYNAAGDLMSMTTPSGATTQWDYDGAGRRVYMESPDGRYVEYEYNTAGELSSIVQPRLMVDQFPQADGAVPSSVNWTRTMTTGATAVVQGGETVMTVPNMASASVTLTSKVAARMDSEIHLDYRFTSVDVANKTRLVMYARYSTTGHYRAEIEAGATVGTVYKRVGSTNTKLGTFQALPGITPRSLVMFVQGSSVTVQTNDPANVDDPPPSETFTSAGVTAAGMNRISLTRVTGTSSVAIDNWVQFDMTAPNVMAGYTYNADGQITNEALVSGSRSYSYTNGRRTGFTETLPGASRSTTLTYDTTGRIATETTGTITTTYGYDPASQLLSVTPTTGSATSYTYDVLGRRSNEKIGTAAATRYVYDAAGQLCWTTTKTLPASPSCATPLSGAATFAWDQAGRLVNETRTATNKVDYTYDPAGRLTTIGRLNGTVSNTQTRTYTADGMLAQTSSTLGAATTTSRYTWDPTVSQVPQLSSIDTAGATWNLNYGPAGWASAHSSAVLNPVAVATDVHGSVIASTGNALARNSAYTAYGTPSGANTFEPRLGYRGELTLDNQLWLRARTYQPTIGRFTAVDPVLGQPGSPTIADPYHYSTNDPTNRFDPTGQFDQNVTNGDRIGDFKAYGVDGSRAYGFAGSPAPLPPGHQGPLLPGQDRQQGPVAPPPQPKCSGSLCSNSEAELPFETISENGYSTIAQLLVVGSSTVGSTNFYTKSELAVDYRGVGAVEGTWNQSRSFANALILLVISETYAGRWTSRVIEAWKGEASVSNYGRWIGVTFSLDTSGPNGGDPSSQYTLPWNVKETTYTHSDLVLGAGQEIPLPPNGVALPFDNQSLLQGQLPQGYPGIVISKGSN
jgi:RHS repeat-associated protein